MSSDGSKPKVQGKRVLVLGATGRSGTAYKSLSILFAILGAIHGVVGFVTFESFSVSLMWFLGQGLMMIFVGFLNLIESSNVDVRMNYRNLTFVANFVSVIYFSVYFFVDAKVIFPALVLIGLTILNLMSWRFTRCKLRAD